MPDNYLTVQCHACRRRLLKSDATRVRDLWFHKDSERYEGCVRSLQRYQRYRSCLDCGRLLLVEANGKCPTCNGAPSAREALYNA